MPNIPEAPTFASSGTTELPTPFDTTDKTIPAQALVQVGKAADKLGKAALDFAQKEKDQADATAVQEAETAYSQEIQKRLYGTQPSQDPAYEERLNAGLSVSSDPGSPGFKSLQGHAALEQSAEALKAMEDVRRGLSEKLSNPRQQQLFLARTQADLVGAQRQVEQHTFEQDQKIKEVAFKTSMRTSAQGAVNAYLDPLERQRQIEATRDWLEVEAERQGLKGRDAEVFVQKYQGAIAEEVLQRIMAEDGRASDAKAFLDQNRQRIGPDASKYDNTLRRLSIVEQATDEVKRIEQAYFDDPSAQQKAVAALPGEVGAKALDIFRERQTLAEASRRVADNAKLGTVLDNIESRRVLNSAQLEHDPAFNKMSDEGKAKAREHLRLMLNSQRINDAEWRRQQREADLAMLHDFQARPLDERADVDVNQLYAGSASPNGLNIIKAQQLKDRKERAAGGSVKEAEFDHIAKSAAQGIITDKQDMEDFLGVMRRLRSNWLSAPGNEGKPLPRDEVNKWITEQLTRKDVPWGFDKFVFQIAPEKVAQYKNASDQPYWKRRIAPTEQVPAKAVAPPSVPTRKQASSTSEIPPEVLKRITQEYDGWRAQHPGKPPVSDAMIIRAYNQGLAQGAW